MATSRLHALEAFLQKDPDDVFTRYLLALEYRKLERLATAITLLEQICQKSPPYVPAYFQLGQCYEQIGKYDEARQTYRSGIQVARQAGDFHAATEMQAALDMLADDTE